VLAELSILNYAVIDRLRLSWGPGLNALTGETGAGKSIIIDALGLVLGDRADGAVVRAGAEKAVVEAIFELDPATRESLGEDLPDLEDGTVILSREVLSTGRSVARINARAVPQRTLAEVGRRLVDIHGQGDHLSLLDVGLHLELIDRYGGLLTLRADFSELAKALGTVRRRMRSIEGDQAAALRRSDLLKFQISEIAAAKLAPDEEETLRVQRSVLANAESIGELLSGAYEALDGGAGGGSPSAAEQVSLVERNLSALEKMDPSAGKLKPVAESIRRQLDDLRLTLREAIDQVEVDPRRLAEVEDRLNLISGLKRKYGQTVGEVLDFGARAETELVELQNSESSLTELAAEEAALLKQAADLAGALSLGRRRAALELTGAVEAELESLGLPGGRIAVLSRFEEAAGGLPVAEAGHALSDGLVPPEAEAGPGPEHRLPLRFDATGVDRLEFVVSLNPGEPLRPLAKVSSGGETARMMLALKGILSRADRVPTLVFDEVDAGIGGRIGEVVGEKLWSLGREHQVLAVTHLPQIAAFADLHLQVSKSSTAGRTHTRAVEVSGDERVLELSSMLGSDTPATRSKASELLSQTSSAKAAATPSRGGA
jgi:DNA repair protein RecN (Recombination protein N)